MTKAPTQTLDFTVPHGFGAPVASLIIVMNDRGEPHIHAEGTSNQTLFLASQGLNYAICKLVVEALQRSLGEAALPWPVARKEGNS